MSLDWILNPLTQYGVLGAGLIGCFSLWVMAQLDVRSGQKSMEAFREATESTVRGLTEGIDALRAAPPVSADPVSVATLTQSLNLTKRTQVLRMHRRGEPVTSIAGALGIPHGEVELLLKLDQFFEGQLK